MARARQPAKATTAATVEGATRRRPAAPRALRGSQPTVPTSHCQFGDSWP